MRELVERYFAAMARGTDGHDDLVELFADDGVYAEPFSGTGPHAGREAIRAFLASPAGTPPPGLRVTVERLDLAGGTVEATWRCEAPAFPRPVRGRDRFTVRGGKIARLETTFLED